MILPSQTRFISPQQWVTGLLVSGVVVSLSPAAVRAAVAPSHHGVAAANGSMLAQAVTVIERDSSGDLVVELQRRLTQLGFYDGPITGFFGELTEGAVMAFQRSQGLTADGIVGASTADAMRSGTTSTNSTGPLRLGDQGPRVSQLQQRLVDWGVYSGPVDGDFGERTEAAVMQFQARRDLAVDGIVGTSTEDALNQPSSALPPVARSTSGEDSTESARTPDPTDGLLERTEVGEAVTDLQRRLAALDYYSGPIDGSYGALTEDAVSKFQADNNLTVDGVTGPATLAAINAARPVSETPAPSPPASARAPESDPVAPSGTASNRAIDDPALEAVPIQPARPIVPTETAVVLPVRVELSPEDIRLIQARLKDRGFYNGPVDGVLNDATRAAIATAQQAYEVSPDDLVFAE